MAKVKELMGRITSQVLLDNAGREIFSVWWSPDEGGGGGPGVSDEVIMEALFSHATEVKL